MKTLVVGDVHGRGDVFVKLLYEAGAIKHGNKRNPGWRIIQIGDLVDLSFKTNEIDHHCLETCLPLIDEYLVGNHEYPAIAPDVRSVAFTGWNGRDPKAAAAFVEAYAGVSLEADNTEVKAATSIGDWLITHAGLHPDFIIEAGAQGDSADMTADWINGRFADHIKSGMRDKFFDAIPYIRGGLDQTGGVVWGHWDHLVQAYEESDHQLVKQIVGHTPHQEGPVNTGSLWNIDIGCKKYGTLCCLVTEDEGKSWTVLTI